MDEIKYEEELWQIIRDHNADIEINITFSPRYGTPFYFVKMKVCDIEYVYQGRNLHKRYAEMVKKLKELYGNNLHKYGTKPINQ